MFIVSLLFIPVIPTFFFICLKMFFTGFFSFFCSKYYFDQSKAIYILLTIEVSRVLAGQYIHTIYGAEGWDKDYTTFMLIF